VEFEQIDITGCRLVGPLTKLGHIGPKHHGVVIGRRIDDRKVYVAENRHSGYQLATYEEFIQRYSDNGNIQVVPNDGQFSDKDVAQRALDELVKGGHGIYNLLVNNCESFSNRAIHNHSVSSQVINTLAVTALLIGGVWLIRQTTRG